MGKSSFRGACAAIAGLGLLLVGAGSALAGPALPSGGQVQAGSASIGSPTGSSLTISQTSSRAIIDWSSFSIGSGGTVQFNNGAGATLNRVTGASASSIDGLLSATGSVYLLNPNGVIIGKDGVVDTGGTFAASTLDIANASFMAGGDLTFSGSSPAQVINYGKIGSLGGDVALIAAHVENDGQISAANGDVGLAAGYQVLLRDQLLDDGKFAVLVGGSDTSTTNAGTIQAAEAELRANGGNIYALAGNTGSIIKATGVSSNDGKVFLIAEGGATTAQGEIDAATSSGAGGQVETSGTTVDFTGLTVRAANWLVDPFDLTINTAAATTIDNALGLGTSVALRTTASGTSGPGVQNPSGVGDINIAAALSWSTGAALTLDAYHSINITAPITVSGAGYVALKTDDGGTGGDYSFGLGASGFAGSLSFTDRPGAGEGLAINGQTYSLLYSMADLVNINNDVVGNYALADSINAQGTTYTKAVVTGVFTGDFLGLGHTISNLTIDAPSINYVGLFAQSSGSIRDIGLVDASVSGLGEVGALVGYDLGETENSYSSGSVAGALATGANAGGLVGEAGPISVLNGDQSSASVSGTGILGGLAGSTFGGSLIENSYATGSVNGGASGDVDGGLVGSASGTITNSYATGSVTGRNQLGGLVGANVGTLNNVYATGAVTSNSSGLVAGGLAGYNSGSGTITNAYATGTVYVSYLGGGLIGQNDGMASDVYATGATGYSSPGTELGGLVGRSVGTVTNGYWDKQTTGQSNSAAGVGLTTAQFFTTLNLPGFTFGTTPGGSGWVIVDTDGTLNNAGAAAGGVRPMLLSEYSTTLNNAHQLQLAILNPAADYSLGGDIDASATSDTNTAGLWGKAGFVPLGLGSGFTGQFDGQGYAISGLTIDRVSAVAVGLFADIATGAAVSDLTLTGANVTGLSYVGGLVGYNSGAVSDDTVSGSVTSNGGDFVGGLVGYNLGSLAGSSASVVVNSGTNGFSTGGLVGDNLGAISASSATGQVAGGAWTGGLAGGNTGTLNDSTASGGVSGTIVVGGLIGYNGTTLNTVSAGSGTVSASQYVGGLVGFNDTTGVIIAGSTASATVSAVGGSFAGGLVGYNYGSITGASAGDNVNTGASSFGTGGLVGINASSGMISGSSASGSVTGAAWAGGLVGGNYGVVNDASSATGAVSGTTVVGGLAGYNGATMNTVSAGQGQVSATQYAGGLVGFNDTTGTITSGSTSGATISASGGDFIGGLVGYNYGAITGASASDTVNTGATGFQTGGLVGTNAGSGTISGSNASGQVTGAGWTGGLVGGNYGSITTSSSAGGAAAGTVLVGGLAAYNGGAISRSFSTDSITTGPSGLASGGMVGYNDTAGTITDTYAAGSVGTGSDIGGLVGVNVGSIATSWASGAVASGGTSGGLIGLNNAGAVLNNVYWDEGTTGQTHALGTGSLGSSINVVGIGGTTGVGAEAQATYQGFDFTNIWTINPRTSRPYLRTVSPQATPH